MIDGAPAKTKKGFVRTPHWFFREFLPNASNLTQVKIVTEIINQTIGWHKLYDTSTLGHLAKSIHMSRDAVSRNIQPLVDTGILILTNEKYGVLNTPEIRKLNGNEKNLTNFKINTEVVLTQDKINLLGKSTTKREVVSSQGKYQRKVKTTNRLNIRQNKRNIQKENSKESTTTENSNMIPCEKCTEPVSAMQKTYSFNKAGKVLCKRCFPFFF